MSRTIDADILLTLLDAEIAELEAVIFADPDSDEALKAGERRAELRWARGLVETQAAKA